MKKQAFDPKNSENRPKQLTMSHYTNQKGQKTDCSKQFKITPEINVIGQKWSQNGSNQSKFIQNGSKWSQMVQTQLFAAHTPIYLNY